VKVACLLLLSSLSLSQGLNAAVPPRDPQLESRLRKAFRRPEQQGWIFVHLEGTPSEIGYQHGYLLAQEIEETQLVIKAGLTYESRKEYAFFRSAAETVFWPHVEEQYREELKGIVDGLNAKGVRLDLWDIVALNAWQELSPYYVNYADRSKNAPTAEHCSAFVATGDYTKDGKPVIAHNAWTDYKEGSRWNIMFDIAPSKGHRFLMDGMAGLIHSGDDFGINDAGIAITETTIGYFSQFDPQGIPEFVRARKAMQYSESIDDFARIMKKGNNGAYANNWLLVDNRRNEIASLELGLKNVILKRSKNGYFAGANYPANPKLIRDETNFPVNDMSISANARHKRWDALMAENKGNIDLSLAQKFLGDHFDTFDNKEEPGERSLCGHIDLSPRGSKPSEPPYAPAGAVQNKAADSAMIERMELSAAMGHACGLDFHASEHLQEHPEFGWQKDILQDLDSHAWTRFEIVR
jgi:hypothetical protein